jgi:hypothetical protein
MKTNPILIEETCALSYLLYSSKEEAMNLSSQYKGDNTAYIR